MCYLLMWLIAIAVGVLFFREYFWVNIVILFLLHYVNHRRCGEFTKYVMTDFFPMIAAQIISVALGEQLSQVYGVWIAPVLERGGIPIPEKLGEQVPFVMAVLLFLIMEAFSMWWVSIPIKRNHSSFMKNILRSNGFRIFSNQMSNILRALDEETRWDAKNFVHLNAEMDILYDNKARSKTKDLLHALQQSPRKNNITLVIGEPGSGKSVAMRGLCAALLKKCQKTQRIPLYVNLKNWNKNWKGDRYPTQKDLENFILDSFDQYSMDHFLRKNFGDIMENGGWFFILDSYDEIPFLADKKKSYSSHVSKTIYDFLSSNGGVLSSRPFRSPDVDLTRVGNHFRILPFNEGQLIQFFKKEVDLSEAVCRGLFAERPDIVDLSRTPLLASLVLQYYREKKDWPVNQRELYQEVMTSRVRKVSTDSEERGDISSELIMEMTATLAYKMMETESSHGFFKLEEVYNVLPYSSCQVDAMVELLDMAKICKVNGTNRDMITFVHRRFMEFFVTQSSQFNQQTVQNHLSDIETLGSYYDVLALYGEICEPDNADTLAKACYQVIMKPENDFQNVRNKNCLYAINSLNFLFNAFRHRLESVTPYITPISEKVLKALDIGCQDNVCLTAFATVVPILSKQCQEDILVALLDFKYRWISQYLSRIFYRGGRNSEELLLAYIENLNSYQDFAFLRELPVFLFVFAREKSLRQYCFLRVGDIILVAVTAAMLGGYAVQILFSDQLLFTLRDPMTWIVWFQSLPLSIQICKMVLFVIFLVCCVWLADNFSVLRAALIILITFVATVTDLVHLPHIVFIFLFYLIVVCRLSETVTLRLKLHKTKGKSKVIGDFLLGIGVPLIWITLLCVVTVWLFENTYFFIIFSILDCLLFVFYINPVLLILDAIHLRAALRELEECDGTLLRSQLEQMLYDIRGERSRAKLIVRLSHMNIQLTGDWISASRPIIGIEREDQLLTSLDTKDFPLTH